MGSENETSYSVHFVTGLYIFISGQSMFVKMNNITQLRMAVRKSIKVVQDPRFCF